MRHSAHLRICSSKQIMAPTRGGWPHVAGNATQNTTIECNLRISHGPLCKARSPFVRTTPTPLTIWNCCRPSAVCTGEPDGRHCPSTLQPPTLHHYLRTALAFPVGALWCRVCVRNRGRIPAPLGTFTANLLYLRRGLLQRMLGTMRRDETKS